MQTHRKQALPASTKTYEAHSTYTAGLGAPDRCRYRRTPPGAPTVADLVRPGDTISTSYNTGGVVVEVKEHFYAAPTGETLSHFTIVYLPPDRTAKHSDADRHSATEFSSCSRQMRTRSLSSTALERPSPGAPGPS